MSRYAIAMMGNAPAQLLSAKHCLCMSLQRSSAAMHCRCLAVFGNEMLCTGTAEQG